MAISEMSQSSCYSAGADLWVVPEIENSSLTAKIDWYTNFQLSRVSSHVTTPLQPYVQFLVKECELDESRFSAALDAESRGKKYMVPTTQYLPNKYVVILTDSKNLESWVESINQVWEGLRRPNLRVFLPKGLTSTQFISTWKNKNIFEDFFVVVEN